MRSLLLTLASCILSGCISIEAGDVHNEQKEQPAPALSAKEASALAWEENVSGKPIVLRRTTLIVRDMEKSLALYRDALGMTVQYDQELTSPGLSDRHGDDGENRSRLVFVQAANEFIGVIGLWQFLDQTEKDLADSDPADFTPGEIVFVFNTTTLKETFAKAAASPGVTVLSAPKERRYPSPAGEIVTLVSMLVDPDGHIVELNQVLRDPRRQ